MRSPLMVFLVYLVFNASLFAAEPPPKPIGVTEVMVTSERIKKYMPEYQVIVRLSERSKNRGKILTHLASGNSTFIDDTWILNEFQNTVQNTSLSALMTTLNLAVPDKETAIEVTKLFEDLGWYCSKSLIDDSTGHPQELPGRDTANWKYSAEKIGNSWMVDKVYIGHPASIISPPIYEIYVTKDDRLLNVKCRHFSHLYYKDHPHQTTSLAWICPATDGSHFVCADSCERFTVWGFNYDHDRSMRLLEDYWVDEWQTVVEDFLEMQMLGANAVRIHLQVGRLMKSPTEPNEESFAQLKRLVEWCQAAGIYLDITGLGCYLRKEVPTWYDSLDEAARWEVQALFWETIAKTCSEFPSVFCYDLMNEPVLPGDGEKATEWLGEEFAGMCFVQRITLDLAGRTREQVAKAWVDQLVAAIRRHDKRHMITAGAIPWAYTFPGAKPLFYSKEVSENLDFVSVHFYPKKGDVENALKALWAYDIGKPLVVEEMFPLECSQEDLAAFIEGSRGRVDGYFGFYWGKTIEEYYGDQKNLSDKITRNWLIYFKEKAFDILGIKPSMPH